jgi:hypothetical protein
MFIPIFLKSIIGLYPLIMPFSSSFVLIFMVAWGVIPNTFATSESGLLPCSKTYLINCLSLLFSFEFSLSKQAF